MNSIAVIELHSNRMVQYQARVKVDGKFYSFSSLSEAGVRTWLARLGIPFAKQPELTIQERK